MKRKLLLLVVPVLLLLAATTTARRHTRKSEGQFSDEQKKYLDKIQFLAREGGLPEEEWKDITKFDKDVCYDIDCLESALEVMTATNFSVNPCSPNKWLDFVCTRRVSGTDKKDHIGSVGDVVNHQTKELLEDDSGKLDNEFLLKEAQTYYHQCKNKAHDDDKDVKTILKYLSKNYGDWPILTNRDPGEKFEWSEMVADLNRIARPGLTPLLFKVSVSSLITLEIGQTTFLNSGPDIIQMLTRVQKHSGNKRAFKLDQLEAITQYINALSLATIKPTYSQSWTLERLDEQTKKNGHTNISWLKFFKRVFHGTNIEITPETRVFLPVKTVMKILEATEKAEKRAVANVLNFQFASQLLLESTVLLDDLNTFKCTETVDMPRERFCLEATKELFGYSLGTTYLNVYYNDNINTPAIESMMSKIQLGYMDVIEGLPWMEKSTKDFLKDKIQSMTTYITKPDWLRQPGALENFYNGLKASAEKSSSYPMNFLSIYQWLFTKARSHVYKAANMGQSDLTNYTIYDNEWSRYLGMVQAQYHKGVNQARIEGGIVQKPFFGVNRPGFMNFGGLGMVLSHEIGHSFDQSGRHYDKNGKLGEYWDATSKKKYEEWVESINQDAGNVVYQMSETSAETLKPDQTTDENIADALGVQISFLAYKEYLKELEQNGQHEKRLPGLKTFPPEKLFFMKYANMWCEDKDVQSQYFFLQDSVHSTGNTRATLPLKRSRQFAETFGCKMPKQH